MDVGLFVCFKLCYNEGKDNAKEVKEWDVLEKIWILIREMIQRQEAAWKLS